MILVNTTSSDLTPLSDYIVAVVRITLLIWNKYIFMMVSFFMPTPETERHYSYVPLQQSWIPACCKRHDDIFLIPIAQRFWEVKVAALRKSDSEVTPISVDEMIPSVCVNIIYWKFAQKVFTSFLENQFKCESTKYARRLANFLAYYCR